MLLGDTSRSCWFPGPAAGISASLYQGRPLGLHHDVADARGSAMDPDRPGGSRAPFEAAVQDLSAEGARPGEVRQQHGAFGLLLSGWEGGWLCG